MKDKTTLFSRSFTLVVAGQVISLFGNAILRFALPLYLLRETGSPALFGIVTACSFVPLAVLSMIGGILADRANKRNIMVGLDFCTALCLLIFCLALGRLPDIPLFIVILMFLYGISGAYQPAVQASVPLLVPSGKLMAGNAVISQVNTLSSLLGPVTGGMMFSMWGIYPILLLSILCFALSAFMELFIYIPCEKRPQDSSVLAAAKNDLKESFRFMKLEKPFFFSIFLFISVFNLALSAVIIVGTPVLITQTLAMPDTMYGIAQAALALGGLCGGVSAAAAAQKLKLKNAYLLLLLCAGSVAFMGIPLMLQCPAAVSYWVITLMSFSAMGASTLFTIQIYTMVQKQTPPRLLGKIMAVLVSIAMCGQPAGQALYGVLFDLFKSRPWIVLYAAAIVSFLIALCSKRIFSRLEADAG